MPIDRIPVPATPDDVKAFVEAMRHRFLGDLATVRSLIEAMIATEPDLRCVYKLYTRGSLQGGEELKSARKIRLKFDEFNRGREVADASLFDVPDIIGMTVVVSYPSDISLVAGCIDALVERGELVPGVVLPAGPGRGRIVTRHGRAIETGGYFACHYNLRLPGVAAGPICEIQIKTLLHDAWGAKTHDLTYKPAGRIGAELLTSFELLGANLANLDQQSDALRASIVRTSSVREVKRRRVQVAILRESADLYSGRVDDPDDRAMLQAAHAEIGLMTGDTPADVAEPVLRRCLAIFPRQKNVTARLLCYLAAVLQRTRYSEQAQDAIKILEDESPSGIQRLRARSMAALAAFSVGEVGEAIDIAETARASLDALSGSGLSKTDRASFNMVANAFYSSLAYYHADIIGSHDGQKRRSPERAVHYLRESMALYASVGLPAAGLFAGDREVLSSIADTPTDHRSFFALDNEAFVMIQTAATEADIRKASARMHMIHENVPPGLERLSPLVRDYHDYCARMRLAELETLLA